MTKSKFYSYCPDCGTSKEASSLVNSRKQANEHNQSCTLKSKHDAMLRTRSK